MKYTFISDYTASYPAINCITAPCPQKEPKQFKKGDIIDGTPKFSSVQCVKEPCPVGTTLVGVSTPEGLRIPSNVLVPSASMGSSNMKIGDNLQRDAWTGKVEWDNIFNFRNLFWLVVIVYLTYLFMKHVLPLAKKSFGK